MGSVQTEKPEEPLSESNDSEMQCRKRFFDVLQLMDHHGVHEIRMLQEKWRQLQKVQRDE